MHTVSSSMSLNVIGCAAQCQVASYGRTPVPMLVLAFAGGVTRYPPPACAFAVSGGTSRRHIDAHADLDGSACAPERTGRSSRTEQDRPDSTRSSRPNGVLRDDCSPRPVMDSAPLPREQPRLLTGEVRRGKEVALRGLKHDHAQSHLEAARIPSDGARDEHRIAHGVRSSVPHRRHIETHKARDGKRAADRHAHFRCGAPLLQPPRFRHRKTACRRTEVPAIQISPTALHKAPGSMMIPRHR
jgi:hypothetical protein